MVMKLVPAPQGEQDDRVLAAILHAPIVESSPEELAAFEEGVADIRAGRTVNTGQVRARLRTHEQG